MALLYTGIAIANTLVMATGGRVRELATLRLSGATSRQPIGGIALACLMTAALASLVPAALALRRRPVELAGVQEQPDRRRVPPKLS